MIKTPEDRQAGAEIEVTPEMIEAGVEAYVFFDPRVEEKEDLVVDVYVAMDAARCHIIQNP